MPANAREEVAAALFVRMLTDHSDAAQIDWHAWLDADPHNAVAYARIEAAWERAACVKLAAGRPYGSRGGKD